MEEQLNRLKEQLIEDAKKKYPNPPHPYFIDNIVREELAKLKKEEAKILGTAMEKLLPEIYEEKRAIPNAFLRGGLFGLVRKGKRALVDKQIFTMSQYKISFTGYELDQNDLEVWDTLIYLAKDLKLDNELHITLYNLCNEMNLTHSQINRKALLERIKRLQLGQVIIKTNRKEFGGSLINNYYINDNDGKLVIEYNKKLMYLFIDNDYTFVDNKIRQQLGDNQLARWLFCFYSSHKEPIPFSIDFLHKLSGSCAERKEFNRKIKLALENIKETYLQNEIKWEYEIKKNKREYFLIVNPRNEKLDFTKLIKISK